jgi:predicted acyl esterase
VRVIEHAWIPLSDGTRLAARVWLPDGAGDAPVPAILEYLPYRLTDGTAERDALQHPYFAGHGYASVRVDMRGSGNSEGILYDEYLEQEQDDALEILEWLASQPWCDGNVGIIGISWGGFNGLQIAARRPPQLKAVISLCSTDDRYADDVHYVGGCLNAADQLSWASTMFLYNAKPPLPWVVGERWREMWFERIDETPPWIDAWMRHQRRDELWKHGSISEDYAGVECPVYVVGGWADGYTNAVMRMLEGLTCPRKGLIGPWAHAYPEFATPGPRIGFLQKCLRWWDHWLKGVDTGIMDEPMLAAWMPDALEPAPQYDEWPGRWISEPSWPSPNIDRIPLTLGDGKLGGTPAGPASWAIWTSLLHGRHAGQWCPYGVAGDFPTDQRPEDALAFVFDSEPLDEPLELLGYPQLSITLSVDRPQALLTARLCDVWPDGRSTLITRGLLNLTHRDSHEHPQLLEPDRRYEIELRMNATAWSLPTGHRLRLALASAYWPWAWPSPENVILTVFTGEASTLTLPVRPRRDDDAAPSFPPAETARPLDVVSLFEPNRRVLLTYDPVAGTSTVETTGTHAKRLVDQRLELRTSNRTVWTVVDGEPLSAANTVENAWEARRDDWHVRVATRSSMSADATHFHITNVVEAFEGETRVRAKTHSVRIPRDHV